MPKISSNRLDEIAADLSAFRPSAFASPPEMRRGPVRADAHGLKFAPLSVPVEEQQVAAARQFPLKVGCIVRFGPPAPNAGVTIASPIDLAPVVGDCRVGRDDPIACARIVKGTVGHAPRGRIKGLGDVGRA